MLTWRILAVVEALCIAIMLFWFSTEYITSITATSSMSCTKNVTMPATLHGAFGKDPFSTCEYSNCQFKFSDSYSDLVKSPLAVVEFNSPLINQITRVNFLPNQLTLVHAQEPHSFPSVDKLGQHLRYLISDNAAYNNYHQWRQHYRISGAQPEVACDLRKLAHNPTLINSQKTVC